MAAWVRARGVYMGRNCCNLRDLLQPAHLFPQTLLDIMMGTVLPVLLQLKRGTDLTRHSFLFQKSLQLHNFKQVCLYFVTITLVLSSVFLYDAEILDYEYNSGIQHRKFVSEETALGKLHGQDWLAWEGAAHGKSTATVS